MLNSIKLIAIAFLFSSCGNSQICKKEIQNLNGINVGFMLTGELFTNKPVMIYIAKINDPKDWAYNEYFTGKGFTNDERLALRTFEADSCMLKKLYFDYLERSKNVH